jgi:hypothetical protein
MSSSEWEEFFKMAGQYYVVGRFAAFAGLIPITGNLLHHAVEMFLKGGLSKNGVRLVDLKKMGHNLPNIWTSSKQPLMIRLSTNSTMRSARCIVSRTSGTLT